MFLSVDVDVCDPGHAPGTGTPEPGGLSARQLLDSVRRICLELPVVGMDIVEVSPPYDHAEITAALANRVVARGAVRRWPPGVTVSSHDPAGPLLEGPLSRVRRPDSAAATGFRILVRRARLIGRAPRRLSSVGRASHS